MSTISATWLWYASPVCRWSCCLNGRSAAAPRFTPIESAGVVADREGITYLYGHADRHDGCKAEIYEKALPGEFTVVYRDESGKVLEESDLTGVSTYRQRSAEIEDRLRQLCAGINLPAPAELASSGEY